MLVSVRRCIRQTHPPVFQVSQLEVAAIVITIGPTLLVQAYSPPKAALPTADLQILFGLGLPVILAADLNSKSPTLNSRVLNGSGRKLENFLTNINDVFAVGPDDPTSVT